MKITLTSQFVRESMYREYVSRYFDRFNKSYGISVNKFDSWEKNQEFTIYEYVLFQDIQSHAELRIDGLLDALASVDIENDIIFESPSLHANLMIKSKRRFFDDPFEPGFVERLQFHIDSQSFQIPHYEKFLNIKFWNFEAKKTIRNYFVKLEKALFKKLFAFINKKRYEIE